MSDYPNPNDYQDPQGALLRKTDTVKQPFLTGGNTELITESNANGESHNPFYFVKTLEDHEAQIAAIKAAHPGKSIHIWEDSDGKYYWFPMSPETHKQTADRRIATECSSS